MDHRTDSEALLVSESLDERNAESYRKDEIRDHDEDCKKRKSGWEDGE